MVAEYKGFPRKPKKWGYARVSTSGQAANGNSLEDQCGKLRDAGCDEIVDEAYTGTKMDRPKFTKLVEQLKAGDTLVVCKLDRFARTASEGSELVKELLSRGVNVHILNMGLIENTPTGRLILNVLLSFAEFERDMIVERTSEGKAVKRATDPNYKEGRKALEIPKEFYDYSYRVDHGEITVMAACEKLGISRSTWYKWNKREAVIV
jgi:DNA invertase Pin-like site-specific DNA recombinase